MSVYKLPRRLSYGFGSGGLEGGEDGGAGLEALEAEEGFEVVVVGVDDGGVDFRAGGVMAYGVVEEGAAMGRGAVAVGAERGKHFLGAVAVAVGFLALDVALEFEQGGGYDAGCGGVARSRGFGGGAEVPVGDVVGG